MLFVDVDGVVTNDDDSISYTIEWEVDGDGDRYILVDFTDSWGSSSIRHYPVEEISSAKRNHLEEGYYLHTPRCIFLEGHPCLSSV